MQSVLVLSKFIPPVAEAAGEAVPVADDGSFVSFLAESVREPESSHEVGDTAPAGMVAIPPWAAPLAPVDAGAEPGLVNEATPDLAVRPGLDWVIMADPKAAGLLEGAHAAGNPDIGQGQPVEAGRPVDKAVGGRALVSGAAPSTDTGAVPVRDAAPEVPYAKSVTETGEPGQPIRVVRDVSVEPKDHAKAPVVRGGPSEVGSRITSVAMGSDAKPAPAGTTDAFGAVAVDPGPQADDSPSKHTIAERVSHQSPTSDGSTQPVPVPATDDTAGPARAAGLDRPPVRPAQGAGEPERPSGVTRAVAAPVDLQVASDPETSVPYTAPPSRDGLVAVEAVDAVPMTGPPNKKDDVAPTPLGPTNTDESQDLALPSAAAHSPAYVAGFWERLFAGLAAEPVPAPSPADTFPGADDIGFPSLGPSADRITLLHTAASPSASAATPHANAVAFAEEMAPSMLPLVGTEDDEVPDRVDFAVFVPGGTASPLPGGLTGSATPLPVPHVAAQITAALSQSADGAMELALSPEELGHVRLRLERDSKHPDRVVVMITFERPETLDLFRRHAGELAEALRSAGYAGADIGFGQQGGGSQTPDRNPGLSGPGSDYGAGQPGLADTPTAPSSHPRLTAGASLDLRL